MLPFDDEIKLLNIGVVYQVQCYSQCNRWLPVLVVRVTCCWWEYSNLYPSDGPKINRVITGWLFSAWMKHAVTLMYLFKSSCAIFLSGSYPVVKVVMWSRGGGLTWWSQVGANPIPIPHPTNLALFGHKITFYQFNQAGLILLQGAQIGAGGWAPWPPTLTTVRIRLCCVFYYIEGAKYNCRMASEHTRQWISIINTVRCRTEHDDIFNQSINHLFAWPMVHTVHSHKRIRTYTSQQLNHSIIMVNPHNRKRMPKTTVSNEGKPKSGSTVVTLWYLLHPKSSYVCDKIFEFKHNTSIIVSL